MNRRKNQRPGIIMPKGIVTPAQPPPRPGGPPMAVPVTVVLNDVAQIVMNMPDLETLHHAIVKERAEALVDERPFSKGQNLTIDIVEASIDYQKRIIALGERYAQAEGADDGVEEGEAE